MTEAITSMIADVLVQIATDAVQTDLADVCAGWRVQIGPLQENPESDGVNVMVYTNDPDDEGGWTHSVISQWPESNPMTALRQLPGGFHELGGGFGYKRRFTIELQIFMGNTGYDELSDRLRLAEVVVAAVEHGFITDGRLGPSMGSDSFSESVIRQDNNIIAKSELIGGGKSGIYRGKIWLEVSTHRDVRRNRV